MKKNKLLLFSLTLFSLGTLFCQSEEKFNNLIITEKFTVDPATIVYNDSAYLYAGHDQAPMLTVFLKKQPMP